jgi:hypothetical protein
MIYKNLGFLMGMDLLIRYPKFIPINSQVFIRMDNNKRYSVKLLYAQYGYLVFEHTETKQKFKVLEETFNNSK